MVKYKLVYKTFFNIGDEERTPCERCRTAVAVDVHHVKMKGMGGSKKLDVIENLVGLCRSCHDTVHAQPDQNEMLFQLAEDTDARLVWMKNILSRGI